MADALTNASWDEKKAQRLCSYDTKLLHSLIDELVTVTEINIADIKKALSVGNMQQVFILAHTIKGSAACVYATKLAQAATSLENSVSRNSHDQTRQRVFLNNIEDRYYEFCRVVHEKGYTSKGFVSKMPPQEFATRNPDIPSVTDVKKKKAAKRRISWGDQNEVLVFDKEDTWEEYQEKAKETRRKVDASVGGSHRPVSRSKKVITDLPAVLQKAWEDSAPEREQKNNSMDNEGSEPMDTENFEELDREYEAEKGLTKKGEKKESAETSVPKPAKQRSRSASPPPTVEEDRIIDEISANFKQSMGIPKDTTPPTPVVVHLPVPSTMDQQHADTVELDYNDGMLTPDFEPEADEGLITGRISTSEESFLAFQLVSKLCDAALMFVGTETMTDIGREALRMAQLISKDVEYSGLFFPNSQGRLTLEAASTGGMGEISADLMVEIESMAVSGTPRRSFEKNSTQVSVDEDLSIFSFCKEKPVVRLCLPLSDNNGIVRGVWDVVASSLVIKKAEILSSFMFGCALILVSTDHIRRQVMQAQPSSSIIVERSGLSNLYQKSCANLMMSTSDYLLDVMEETEENLPAGVKETVSRGVALATYSTKLLDDGARMFEIPVPNQEVPTQPKLINLHRFVGHLIKERFSLYDENTATTGVENEVNDAAMANVNEDDLGFMLRLILELEVSLKSVMISFTSKTDSPGTVSIVVRCVGVILNATTLRSLESEITSLPGTQLAILRLGGTFCMSNTQVGDFLGLECVLTIRTDGRTPSSVELSAPSRPGDQPAFSDNVVPWNTLAPIPADKKCHVILLDNCDETRSMIAKSITQVLDHAKVSVTDNAVSVIELLRDVEDQASTVVVVRIEPVAKDGGGTQLGRVCASIREKFPSKVSIVACLNHTENVETALTAHKSGANVVVANPFSPVELIGSINGLLADDQRRITSAQDLHIGLSKATYTSLKFMPDYLFDSMINKKRADIFDQDFEVAETKVIMMLTPQHSQTFADMDAKSTFDYFRTFWELCLDAIRTHGGKCTALSMNGMVVLFTSAQGAFRAACDILVGVKMKNGQISRSGVPNARLYKPSIVLHHGSVGLGMIKDAVENLHWITFSDDVALCHSLVGISIWMGSCLLVTGPFFNSLGTVFLQEKQMDYRPLGSMKVNGRKDGVQLYDFFSLASAEVLLQRKTTRGYICEGVAAIAKGDYSTAEKKFGLVVQATPDDSAASWLLKQAKDLLEMQPKMERLSLPQAMPGLPIFTRQSSKTGF